MPELPEVETVVRMLRRVSGGEVVRDIHLLRPQLVRPMSATAFRSGLRSRRIEAVRRRGKFILMDFTGDRTLLIHLRMTGGFFYAGPACELPGTTRLVFHLQSGCLLGFTDRRNLGIVKLIGARQLAGLKELQQLGLEPLEPEFTVERFGRLLERSRRPIKEFLLDQTRVVGLGNIYAAEALFRAGINPRRMALKVARSPKRLLALHQSIIETLQEAVRIQESGIPMHFEFIGVNGDHARHRSDDVGRAGSPSPQVYGREGKPCFRCGGRIRRIRQAGRSTCYCPRCQK